MGQLNDLQTMLDRLDCPAFLVQDGFISAVNAGAQQRMAEPGFNIREILLSGAEEYESFTDGCLHLTITLSGTTYACSVTKLQQSELFCLDEALISAELQAMALAASQLRIPISEMSLQLNKLKDVDEKQFATLSQNIYRLQRIVGNMSDAAAFVNASPRKMTQEMCSLFQTVLEKAQTLLSQSGVQIRYQLPQQPIFCLADPDMLTRAVYNLLSNACKYAIPQKPIEVTLKKVGSKLYLTVCDNGEGVETHLRSTMFTRYKRQPGLEDPRHGMGLGMAIIIAAAAAHGGTVLVQHSEESGTQVTMSLSIEKSSDSTVRSPVLRLDNYGGQDQALIELSDVLPPTAYEKDKI